MFERFDFLDNANVGVFGRANDDVIFLRKGLPKKIKKRIKEALSVDLVELTIGDANIVGSLLCCNSHGVVVNDLIRDEDIQLIQDLGYDVCIIHETTNAAGNDLLANDTGCLAHPELSEETCASVADVLNVPCVSGTIGRLETVGMAALATNKGVLCHPKITEDEKRIIASVFNVPVMIGTVNHGIPLIGSGLIANTKGAIVGSLTTGIEMGRIEEALGFLS